MNLEQVQCERPRCDDLSRSNHANLYERSFMAVPTVPAPSPEVKIPSGDPGVIYHEVVGCPGYAIGDDGAVWSAWRSWGSYRKGARAFISDRWRKMKLRHCHGYPTLKIRFADGIRRHRTTYVLVLEAFVGPCPEGMEACHHPDRTRTNCRLENLRWDTHINNESDKREHGSGNIGVRNGQAKLSESTVLGIYKAATSGGKITAVARQFGASLSQAQMIRDGKIWSMLTRGIPNEKRTNR